MMYRVLSPSKKICNVGQWWNCIIMPWYCLGLCIFHNLWLLSSPHCSDDSSAHRARPAPESVHCCLEHSCSYFEIYCQNSSCHPSSAHSQQPNIRGPLQIFLREYSFCGKWGRWKRSGGYRNHFLTFMSTLWGRSAWSSGWRVKSSLKSSVEWIQPVEFFNYSFEDKNSFTWYIRRKCEN